MRQKKHEVTISYCKNPARVHLEVVERVGKKQFAAAARLTQKEAIRIATALLTYAGY